MPRPLLASTLAILLACILTVGCSKPAATSDSAKPSSPSDGTAATSAVPTVYTTFYPTQYFTQRIGGPHVNVVCPVPPDEDAIFWQPPADVIAAYQKADLIVLNGAGFAKWTATATLPESRTIDTAASFKDRYITIPGAVTHSHGPAGSHTHAGLDGHTWVDPVNAKIQAGAIRDALVARWPAHKADFERNYGLLAGDLDVLDAELKAMPTTVPLLASHPAYNYLAARYGWSMVSLDLDPEAMPSAEALAHLKATLAEHPAPIILWESEPLPETSRLLATDYALSSIEFSPCELLDPALAAKGEDYLSVMSRNIVTLRTAFAATTAAPAP